MSPLVILLTNPLTAVYRGAALLILVRHVHSGGYGLLYCFAAELISRGGRPSSISSRLKFGKAHENDPTSLTTGNDDLNIPRVNRLAGILYSPISLAVQSRS